MVSTLTEGNLDGLLLGDSIESIISNCESNEEVHDDNAHQDGQGDHKDEGKPVKLQLPSPSLPIKAS